MMRGVPMLGAHMVTVPFGWPNARQAFQGFCLMTSHVPILVGMDAII